MSRLRSGDVDTKPGAEDSALAEAIRAEHDLSFSEAAKLYPAAMAWSAFVSIGVIMLAFDPQLVGNFFAMPQFTKDFGYVFEGEVRITLSPRSSGLALEVTLD